MSVGDVFPISPDFGIRRKLSSDVITTPISGNLKRRKLRSALQLRTFDIDMTSMSVADFKLLNAFYQARDGMYDSFSFLPAYNQDRLIEGLSVGTGDGSTVEFDLDNTDFYRRVYTGTGTRNQAYVDGSPVGATFANTDGSKTSAVTYDSAPGGSTVLTVDIDRYVICSFITELEDTLEAYAILSAPASFEELARKSI
jgi:hypothetical protein